MRYRIITAGAIAAAALFWTGCSEDDNPGGGSPYGYTCENVLRQSGTYHVVNSDTLAIYWPQKITTTTACNGGAFTMRTDTTAAKADSFQYMVRGDSLFLTTIAPSPVQGATGYLLLLRDPGSGVGLQGAWRYDTTVIVTAGAIDAVGLLVLQGYLAVLHPVWKATFNGVYWHIVGSAVNVYVSTFFADAAIAQLALEGVGDTSRYSITVERVNDCVVKATGTANGGETVTAYGDGGENVHYSSTNPAHGAFVYYKNPPSIEACPNSQRPEWWAEFVNANRK